MPCSNNTSDLSEAVRRDDQKAHAGPAAIAIREEFGWRRYSASTCVVWFKGWVTKWITVAFGLARGRLRGGRAERLAEAFASLDGHFAIVATGPGWSMAAVDWVRSIPLAVAEIDGAWTIDDQADRLRRRAGLSGEDINLDVAREIAMAGYGIDNRSLYNGLHVLGPGELMWFENKEPRRTRYYTYQPWKTGERADPPTENDLADCTLGLIQRLLQSLDGRPLVVPLSAGYDPVPGSSARPGIWALGMCSVLAMAARITMKRKLLRRSLNGLAINGNSSHATGELRRFFNGEEYSAYLRFAGQLYFRALCTRHVRH